MTLGKPPDVMRGKLCGPFACDARLASFGAQLLTFQSLNQPQQYLFQIHLIWLKQSPMDLQSTNVRNSLSSLSASLPELQRSQTPEGTKQRSMTVSFKHNELGAVQCKEGSYTRILKCRFRRNKETFKIKHFFYSKFLQT